MERTRLFLGANAVLWIAYGLYCLAQPGFLAEAAGITATTSTGTTELRAMYGGLQIAIGALALIALLRPDVVRAALIALAFLAAGLFSGRLIGVLSDGGLSAYTVAALILESTLTVLSITYLRKPAPVS